MNHSYPLAAGSRMRRRRLLGLLVADPTSSPPPSPLEIDELIEGVSEAAPDERATETAVLDLDASLQTFEGLSLSDLEPVAAPPAGDDSVVLETERPTLPIKPPSFQPIKRLLTSEQPATWVFTGDGITHGGMQTQGLRNFVEHFAERIRAELGRAQDVIINTGIPGQTSTELLDQLEWRALRFLPDVVSVTIGLDDAQAGPGGRGRFRDNLRRIVASIVESGALPLLHTPHRIDLEGAADLADVRSYVKILRDTALEFDVPCIDHWAHWKKLTVQTHLQRGWLADDNRHPGAVGHQEIARLIFRRLGIYDDDSGVCREMPPVGRLGQ